MTDQTCTCPDLGDLTRAGLEGRDIASCPIHRPTTTTTGEPIALNDLDALADLARAGL